MSLSLFIVIFIAYTLAEAFIVYSFAKQKNIKLVTEDQTLKAKAQKYVQAQTTTVLLSA